MILPIFLMIIGILILLYGGDMFVKGASSLARKLKVSTMVIGLTIVAFGTSAPEMVVNIFSAIQGSADLAVGNVLGSNIANILLVLGVSAIIRPLVVKRGTTWKEIPFGLLAVIVLFLLGNDVMFGNNGVDILTRGDGLVLIAFFIIFLYYTYGLTKVEGEAGEKVDTYTWTKSSFYIIGGIAGLVFGGKLIVDNAVILARLAGLSELFIGLTVMAIGTSLPELATSAIAAYRGHVDLAIGNVIGSNIFNILWVLGLTPIIAPMRLSPGINFDMGMTALAALLLFIFMFTGGKKHHHTLRRQEGIMMITLYIAYIIYISVRG